MAVNVPELFRLWGDHSVTREEICRAFGISMNSLYRLSCHHKLPPRPRRSRDSLVIDPTPQEIQERAAEVRASWSPEVERQRRVFTDGRWRPPAYDYDSRSGIFSY